MTPEEQRIERVRAEVAALEVATNERALEVSLKAAGMLFDKLEGAELRDAVVRIVSQLEAEVRSRGLLIAALLQLIGVDAEDEMVVTLQDRATR